MRQVIRHILKARNPFGELPFVDRSNCSILTWVDDSVMKHLKIFASILLGLALGACASKPPAPISKQPQDNPSLLRVRMDIDAYIGREVRWGGVISRVENRADVTWVEIVRYE